MRGCFAGKPYSILLFLNQVASAIAREHGVPVLDVKPLTVKMMRGKVTQKPASRLGVYRLGLSDVDFHHGYGFTAQWHFVYAGALVECRKHFGWES